MVLNITSKYKHRNSLETGDLSHIYNAFAFARKLEINKHFLEKKGCFFERLKSSEKLSFYFEIKG